MGIIGSHVDLTSERRRHQAKCPLWLDSTEATLDGNFPQGILGRATSSLRFPVLRGELSPPNPMPKLIRGIRQDRYTIPEHIICWSRKHTEVARKARPAKRTLTKELGRTRMGSNSPPLARRCAASSEVFSDFGPSGQFSACLFDGIERFVSHRVARQGLQASPDPHEGVS